MRKECNRLIVFAISGFWHGASLAFIFWGMLNGVYQVLEDAVTKIKQSIIPDASVTISNRFSRRLFQTIFTFCLITFAWLFFRAGSLEASFEILTNMFGASNWGIFFDGSLYELGVARNEMNILLVSILILFIVDYHKYKERDLFGFILKQGYWFRYLIYAILFFTILIHGCYGDTYDAQQFIYFQF